MTRLEELPNRMDALTATVSGLQVEVSDLRKEMREEFSALRSEMAAQGESLRDSLTRHTDESIAALRTHMMVLHEEVLERISRTSEGRRSREQR